MKTPTSKSPKNRFFADIHYSKALSNIGSQSMTGAMTIEDAKHQAVFYTDQAKRLGIDSTVSIRENLKQYPYFEWVRL